MKLAILLILPLTAFGQAPAPGPFVGSAAGGGGSGTVTVVGAGSLTSTALVTGGGTTTVQTPSATATMDASGNISTPGTVGTIGVVFNAVAVLPPVTANAGRVLRYTADSAIGACSGSGTSESLCRSAQAADGTWHWVRVVEADKDGNVTISAALLTNAEFSNGTCATAKTINPANGNRQKVTLTNAQTCALTFTQPVGSTVSIQLKVIQSAAGSFNGLISGGLWPGGSVPTITATSGAVDVVTCYLDGTNAYCVATQDFR